MKDALKAIGRFALGVVITFVGLVLFVEALGLDPSEPSPVGPLALLACAILAWWLLRGLLRRLWKRKGTQKCILFCGTLAFVFCGLFPPWLYIDSYAPHFRSNAGCSFILSPPLPKHTFAAARPVMPWDDPAASGPVAVASGIQIDTSRLLIEWACVLAATGAGWIIFIPRNPAKEQGKATTDPPSLN